MKKQEKVFGFWDNCIWICVGKFFLLWQEYLSSAIEVLINGPNIFNAAKRNFFQLNLSQINETVV